jgi:hypothetical protein
MVALALLANLKVLVSLNGRMILLKSRLIYAGFWWSGFLFVFKWANIFIRDNVALLKGAHVLSSLLSRSSSATVLRMDSRTAFSRASLCFAP